MAIREKIFKGASYIFMTLMLLLIVISFGMPDFISSSAESSRLNAAKVDGQSVSLREVGILRNRMMEQYGADVSDAIRPMIEKQALEQAIYRKLFEIIVSDFQLYPTGKDANKVLAQFYKDNFQDFIVDGKFDFKKLDEFLGQRGNSRIEFEQSFLSDTALNRGQTLLQGSSIASQYDIIEGLRAEQTTVSFSAVILEPNQKNDWLTKNLNISEKEIQERFAKDYLSKDPKDTLSAIKREAIEKSIMNDKKPELEKTWVEDLIKKSNSLESLAALTGTKVYKWENLSIQKSFEQNKPAGAPNFASLDTNPQFQSALFTAETGKLQKPIIEGERTVFFVINKRNISSLPQVQKLVTDKELLKSTIASIADYDNRENTNKSKRYQEAFGIMMENFKANVQIVRYMNDAPAVN
ncbi:MAG: SurA N-terminal domain-containing protein [Leptospiraceae bacterium]|nr:SurA N-terminal domain-containing protein [Leptospiraceae bacterium]